ncbi:F-type H+-transporting ATPase subunitg [Rhodotorula toruloides]|uniref:F-type H+-transporting ATPase subunitg n=1 Tax=Rhodotorula toruloides TaxID=5286 RepID=A0A511K910_RHOTO|nr:F-type H+-transporting ATPase subunitg [Rhodotorula toruloides]
MLSSVRIVLRRAVGPQQVRLASTESAAQKAQSAASGAQAKAQQAIAGVSKSAGNLLGSYKEPVLYNAAVAREFAKQVYVAEQLAPPSFAQFSYTFRHFSKQAPSPSFWRELYKSGEYKRWLLYGVEAYGIFKLGEMIGRKHMVGYKLEDPHTAKLT